jgi:hypothetical protein
MGHIHSLIRPFDFAQGHFLPRREGIEPFAHLERGRGEGEILISLLQVHRCELRHYLIPDEKVEGVTRDAVA